jgi:hypothetical protein
MSTSIPSEMRDSYASMRHWQWSPAEKAVARKAFEYALKREFEALITETKQRAATIKESDDVWELEDHLTRRRKKIDRVYDYRYSVLLDVFGYLVREGRLKMEELQGLAEDKLAYIRAYPR